METIVFDLDGTIVNNNNISEYCLNVISECKSRGYYIGIATARPYYSSTHFANTIKPNIYITSAGALLSINSTQTKVSTLCQSECQKIIEVINVVSPYTSIIVEGVNHYYSNHFDCRSWRGFENAKIFHGNYCDCPEAYKIIFPANRNTLKVFDSVIFEDYSIVLYNKSKWIRISCKEATKINALECALENINVSFLDTITFGDDNDDIEIIKKSGCGIAVCDASSELKKHASHLCDSVENDGVPKWIEKNLLYPNLGRSFKNESY